MRSRHFEEVLRIFRHFVLPGLFALSCSATVIGSKSQLMLPAKSAAPETAPNMASLYILRPSSYLEGLPTPIFNAQGRFLALLQGDDHVVVSLSPGVHWIHSFLSAHTATLRAEVVAGKRYFVLLRPWNNATEGAELQALIPESEDWNKRDDWIANSTRLLPNLSVGQEEFDRHSDDLRLRATYGKDFWTHSTQQGKEQHSLRLEDGR